MQSKNSSHILEDSTLSWQELLKLAVDHSLKDKVYTRKIDDKHLHLGFERRHIEGAYLAARRKKHRGDELPALSEWFYDNRFLFMEQLRQTDMEKRSYRLPHLCTGRFAHQPRSLALATLLLGHSALSVTVDGMQEFLEVYQREAELDSGELWAFGSMLRIALLRAVAVLARQSIKTLAMWSRAERFCAQLEKQDTAEQNLLDEYKNVLENPDFIEHVVMLMRENPKSAVVLSRINRRLALKGQKVESLVKKAHAAQAHAILRISNAIGSLRLLAKTNFETVFENISAVHKYLCTDESYAHMDFASREYYREGITAIATALRTPEPAVARMAAELAAQTGSHVGEFIIGSRRNELFERFGGRPVRIRLMDFMRRHMLLLYAGGGVVSALVSAALLCLSLFLSFPPAAGIFGFIISLIPIYTVAMAVNNRLFSFFVKRAHVPKMALDDGIPESCATMVVIPALITCEEDGAELLERMEVYYAANQHKNIYFALLSDFKEDKNEISAQDEAIIESIEKRIDRLNEQYGRQLFFYAQRKRTLIPESGRFGGYERKRGALLDFCALLDGDESAFTYVTKGLPSGIKYVITLDADTHLGRDAAVRMVGAMEHPLNRPVVDGKTNTVVKGYGIMQPRIGVDVVSAAATRFSLVFSGKGGLDTYASAASDVYQDGFGTGIFTGKGIFNRHVYMQVLSGAFPDNSILSHDLLEGSYLRCALLTDVVLMDGCPSRYTAWAKRQHRWVRGDWQLIPWLRRTVRTKGGHVKNPLSRLAKYQIADNLRRSLSVPLSFLVIVLSQSAFYSNAIFWFISGILPLFIDGILDFAMRIINLIRNAGKGSMLKDAWHETKTLFEQSFYKFAFLPYETYLMLDAMVRTLVRLVTRRNLLEWETAAEGDRKAKMGLGYYWKYMAAAPLLAAALYTLSIFTTHTFSLVAFLVFAVWFFAPSIAHAISRPRRPKTYGLEERHRKYLEDIALRTWRYFERFSEEAEYYWPPDNFQKSPFKGVAKRTSPTNIGYALGASVCALELGFITPAEFLARIDKIVMGIERAEKWQGHLYNWYDIAVLHPLEPRYVSSVDSGNLICYLIVADAALGELILAPLTAHMGQGLSIVSRETGQGLALQTDDDIFAALDTLEAVGENDGPLGDLRDRFDAWLARWAPWVRLLPAFPDKSGYDEPIVALRDTLRCVSLAGYTNIFHRLLELLSEVMDKARSAGDEDVLAWVAGMEAALTEGYVACRRFRGRLSRLRRRIAAIIEKTDFGCLYDKEKGLFSIGYDARGGMLSDSHYDLLASEARQTSFVAIAKGDVPQKHWFRMGRPLTVAGDNRVLLSWGGTMFEYLMPLILMKSYDNTLLGETYRSVVEMQRAYGELRRTPWGVSESGYYAFDLNMNYQYKAFGVPGLGLKSGLVREVVITPYACCLALPVNPRAALANMLRLEKLGVLGKYGFYEAVDYTSSRMHAGKKKQIIKSYMAHHQGMILASIVNCLCGGRIQNLFHSATVVKATELLLQEKVSPRSVTLSLGEKPAETQTFAEEIRAARTFVNPAGYPEGHFLSNGSYTVMLTQYGTGYSECRGRLVSRWESDVLRRAPGIHIYIRNIDTGAVWSATLLPTCLRADEERVTFEPHKASFCRRVGDIETTLDICVSSECDMEVRSLEIRNNGKKAANLSVLCAFSPALSPEKEFEAHPAFAELFIETREDREAGIVYARRRGRNACAAMKACGCSSAEFVTDRTYVFGRRNVFGAPACLAEQPAERDVTRAVGVRCAVEVPAGETAGVAFAVAMADSIKQVKTCLSGLAGPEDIRRVFHLAWTHAQVEMRYLKLKNMQANLFQQIASRAVLRVPTACPAVSETGGISSLWKFGLSGDLPIICIFAHSTDHIGTVQEIVKAQEYLSLKRVSADLVIFYPGSGAYIDPLRDKITELAQALSGRPYNRVVAVPDTSANDADRAAIMAASCLVLTDELPLQKQIKPPAVTRAHLVFEKAVEEPYKKRVPRLLKAFDNGTGGFVSFGSEYCIDVGAHPLLPWSNVLAGRRLGSLVSASGGGYTWAGNARTLRLTPFRNDALTDVPGEGVLVRCDRTGAAFSTAPDLYASGRYRVTHGFGYTVFERFGSIDARTTWFVDTHLPVKTGILRLVNNTEREETVSVYYYAEPALAGAALRARFAGDRLEVFSPFVRDRAMFIAIPGYKLDYTVSALEFFGVPGSNVWPEALKTATLAGGHECGATLLALQAHIRLVPGETKTLTLLMGYGDAQTIESTIGKLSAPETAESKLNDTKTFWQGLVGGIRVSTPVKSLDTLINGWLLYQTYTSRLWGRTGYYQSSGAFGFRDQLQDVLAVLYTDPATARAHILLCARRQFPEGDVLHWWHEPANGLRTRISDDKLFLPYVACEYERVTGDMSVFDEEVPYLEGHGIPDDRRDLYESFSEGPLRESVFLHCVRAIDSALKFGEHGLPLMGAGDWNDGMDKVGEEGRGESVWLAFFLAEVLRRFIALCRLRGEEDTAQRYETVRDELRRNIEAHTWDGQWYLRAFFDDGTPLGSHRSPECRIDLVSQSWAVLSDAAYARRAFASAAERLVKREEGIIRLLEPAFDRWEKNPGYIKSYLPGVRENGGQYTHAAAWFVIAATHLRLKDDALELFQMLNPINHTRTAAGVAKYKGEPYVMAADVYDTESHRGRAGWTWYTGSAGWMYQAAVIHLLGMRIERGELAIYPCLPDNFGSYTIEYARGSARYVITVTITEGYQGYAWLSLDGGAPVQSLPLDATDGVHQISAFWTPDAP